MNIVFCLFVDWCYLRNKRW